VACSSILWTSPKINDAPDQAIDEAEWPQSGVCWVYRAGQAGDRVDGPYGPKPWIHQCALHRMRPNPLLSVHHLKEARSAFGHHTVLWGHAGRRTNPALRCARRNLWSTYSLCYSARCSNGDKRLCNLHGCTAGGRSCVLWLTPGWTLYFPCPDRREQRRKRLSATPGWSPRTKGWA